MSKQTSNYHYIDPFSLSCFSEGQSDKCGKDCYVFINGGCEVPDEVLEYSYADYLSIDEIKEMMRKHEIKNRFVFEGYCE